MRGAAEKRGSDRWRRGLRLGWIALGLLAVSGAAAAAVATFTQSQGSAFRVRVGSSGDESRVVVELDQPASAKLVSVEGPSDHIVIALPNIRPNSEFSGDSQGLLKHWRMEEAAGAAKLALDFGRAAVVKRRFLLPPDDGVKVYRYVIDFESAAPALRAAAQVETLSAPVKGVAPTVAPAPQKQLAAAPGHSRKVVVIDPGHGGKDPGASGANGKEKDVALTAARALRDRLQATGRYQVVLTRNDDTFIPLEQRVQIARRESADLFISLHADSINDPSLHGATVYTLSEKGADRVARQVFSRSDWFINVDLHGRDPSVNRILLDLTQRETTNQSSGFANLLLDRLAGRVDLLRRSHRDANYMVLLAPDVPCILLEMGFISNPLDEQRLTSADGRRQLTEAVTDAIDAYFSRQTRLAVR